jgi:hypothetical protein
MPKNRRLLIAGGILQRRFWEHAIRDPERLDRHVDYSRRNPVKYGLVAEPGGWPSSTYHEWMKEFGRPINVPLEDWKPVHPGER